MRLIDADEYKGKCICNHLYSGVTKLMEVDAVPTAFDLENVIEKLKSAVYRIDDSATLSSRDVINEEDVFEILKSAVNERMKFGQ